MIFQKNGTKKKISIPLIIFFLLSMFAGAFPAISLADGGGSVTDAAYGEDGAEGIFSAIMGPLSGSDPGETIPHTLDSFKLEIDGFVLPDEAASITELDQDQLAEYEIKFLVDLSEKLYRAGDYFEFELPPSILDFGNLDGVVDRADAADAKFEYKTTGGKVTVTLIEDITPEQANSNVPVTLKFASKFSFSEDEDDLDQEIVIPIPGGGTER